MIRNYQNQDLDEIMKLWLETNISAHSFINETYWQDNFAAVKEMMPKATLYVYEGEGIIQGFIGLNDSYIAGIFVSRSFQSRGIGKALLDYAKMQNKTLLLSVYEKNAGAINFYKREGFSVSKSQMDESTGETELCMNYRQKTTALPPL